MARPDIVAIAVAEIGTVEGGGRDGRSGNIVRYWADEDPSLQGASWCAAFVSWVYARAGSPLPAVDRPYGFINVYDGWHWAKAHNQITTEPEPGDIVLYGIGQGHTGIFEKWLAPGLLSAVEGNTSPGSAGSQSNGGGVYRRTRTTGMVLAFWRPNVRIPDKPQGTTILPDFNPPIQIAGRIVSQWTPPEGGVLLFTDTGLVYAWGTAQYHGAPGADPATNWAAGNRQGAHIGPPDGAGHYTCVDTAGEHFTY